MFKLIKDICGRRELLFLLVDRNLKIRYKNSVLGFFWSLLTPLLFIAIYGVFAHILNFNATRHDYLQFLIVGIVVWQFLVTCLNDALGVIIGNAALIKKTTFPRLILPLSMVLANLINFLLTFVVLLIYLFAVSSSFASLALFPVVLLTQCALCLGISLILAVSNVFFRDTEHILAVLTLAWFFLTPIFYPIGNQLKFIPPASQWLVFLNPMTGIVCGYRAVLMGDVSVAPHLFWISFGVSWVLLVIGLWCFQRLAPRLADEM